MSEIKSDQSRRPLVAKGRLIVGLASAIVMAVTGAGWAGYNTTVGRIITSHVLPILDLAPGQSQNVLLMGLDSRLDQNGQPLPQEMYDALHAGDETSGGYNANVLILVHIPGGDGPVTAVSIPRDDYVDLSGCPGSVCKGKIKQAYGLAYQEALDEQANGQTGGAGVTDLAAREQAAREAGRKAEINTVRDFLGVSIDHFIEVTLGGFFQIAKVVEPLTVCLNEDTSDSYSGADFRQGVQEINASQAMAFVRQRRDENDGSFTDLDRTRRQQAFLVSLMNAVGRGEKMSSPGALDKLLQAARDNIAVDAGLDIMDFASRATQLKSRSMSFYTLPISDFGHDGNGSSVNLVDLAAIRQIVHDRFSSDTPAAASADPAQPPAAPRTPAVRTVLDVINATAHDGLAGAVEDKLSDQGFVRGSASTADTPSDDSTVQYGTGAEDGAHILADQLHVTPTASDSVAPGTVQLTVGTKFPAGDYLSHMGSAPDPSSGGQVTAVSATATGTEAPAPTDLSQMSASGVPCVK